MGMEIQYVITEAKKLWSDVEGIATLAGDAFSEQKEKFEHTTVRVLKQGLFEDSASTQYL